MNRTLSRRIEALEAAAPNVRYNVTYNVPGDAEVTAYDIRTGAEVDVTPEMRTEALRPRQSHCEQVFEVAPHSHTLDG